MPPILMIAIEAVPIAEVRRLASKFFDCRCQKSAGILCVFQDFLAKAGGKFAVKMRAAAIGTASESFCQLFNSGTSNSRNRLYAEKEITLRKRA